MTRVVSVRLVPRAAKLFLSFPVEAEQLVSQNVIPHKTYLGGALPYAFTEQGVASGFGLGSATSERVWHLYAVI